MRKTLGKSCPIFDRPETLFNETLLENYVTTTPGFLELRKNMMLFYESYEENCNFQLDETPTVFDPFVSRSINARQLLASNNASKPDLSEILNFNSKFSIILYI